MNKHSPYWVHYVSDIICIYVRITYDIYYIIFVFYTCIYFIHANVCTYIYICPLPTGKKATDSSFARWGSRGTQLNDYFKGSASGDGIWFESACCVNLCSWLSHAVHSITNCELKSDTLPSMPPARYFSQILYQVVIITKIAFLKHFVF